MAKSAMVRKGKFEAECVVPPSLPAPALRDYVFNDAEHEARAVEQYVELEPPRV